MACALNGRIVKPAPSTAKEFLTCIPRCAYTTTLVLNSFYIADWGTHLERLSRSLHALQAATGMYAAYFSWLKVGTATNHTHLVVAMARHSLRGKLSRATNSRTVQAVPEQDECAVIHQLVEPTVLCCLSTLEPISNTQEAILIVALAPAGSRCASGCTPDIAWLCFLPGVCQATPLAPEGTACSSTRDRCGYICRLCAILLLSFMGKV